MLQTLLKKDTNGVSVSTFIPPTCTVDRGVPVSEGGEGHVSWIGEFDIIHKGQ